MNCDTCVNNYNGKSCRIMKPRPKTSWCYMTKEQAVAAERAIIEYIDKHPAQTDEEYKSNKIARKWAHNHIARLMSKEV